MNNTIQKSHTPREFTMRIEPVAILDLLTRDVYEGSTLSFKAQAEYPALALQYIEARTEKNPYLSDADAALTALGRMQWLLSEAYCLISDKFTESELIALMDCNVAGPRSPHEIDTLASSLLDHHGIELEDYEQTTFAPLVDKLLELNPLERLVLVDALEVAYRDLSRAGSVKEAFAALGIELQQEG